MLSFLKLRMVTTVCIFVMLGCSGDSTDSSAPPHSHTPSWGTAELIEFNDDTHASNPQIGIDGHGNAIVVWYQNDDVHHVNSIWANRFDATNATWGTAELIEFNAYSAIKPQISVYPNGDAIAVWEQDDGNSRKIWSNRFDAATESWGTAELVESDDTADASDAQIAVDSSGNAIAVWCQHDSSGYNIWSNRFDESTASWGTAELIESDDTGPAGYPQIAVGNSGNAIAVWQQGDGSRYNIWSNKFNAPAGNWGVAELIESDNAGAANFPQVAVDGDGNAIAVWYQHDGTSQNINANRYDATMGTWGTAELIEFDDTGSDANPRIDFDSYGNAIIVWQRYYAMHYSIWYNYFDGSTGTWDTAELIEYDDANFAGNPQIDVDNDGNAMAVWSQSDGIRNNVWACRYEAATSSWGVSELIESEDFGYVYDPQIVVDNNNNAISVWYQSKNARYDIWANRFQ